VDPVVVVVGAVVVVVGAVVVVVGAVVVVVELVAIAGATVIEVVEVGYPPCPWPFTWQGTIFQPQRQVQPEPCPCRLWVRTL
jgi:hypothetical protein